MEKILKTLESIKVPSLVSGNESNIPGQLQSAVVAAGDGVKTKKKERISHCIAVTDAVCTSSVQSLPDYSKLLESVTDVLFILCNDSDSDIRLVANDCLNRIARTLKDQLLHRFQMEIYKEIKKNRSARSLRAALNLFAFMSPLIRPQKCRAFMQNLLPCFSQISTRHEDLLYESLPGSFSKIFENLGTFLNDEEIKALCNNYVLNLESKSPIIRRSSAALLVSICQFSRKPIVFVPRLLQQITDLLLPNVMEKNTTIIIGVLVCVRQCLPFLYGYLKQNYKVHCLEQQFLLVNLMRIFETCMILCNHDDHNVITTALETILLMITDPPDQMASRFKSPSGLPGSYVVEGVTKGMEIRDGPRVDIYESLAEIKQPAFTERANLLLESSSMSLEGDSDVPTFLLESSVSTSICEPDEEFDIDASISSSGRNSDIFIMANTCAETENDNGELALLSDEEMDNTRKSNSVIDNIPELAIGSLLDPKPLVYYCCRFLAYNFLLSGKEGEVRHDSESRISIKVLATNCINHMIILRPEVFFMALREVRREMSDPELSEIDQYLYDICLFKTHTDPLLRGSIYVLVGNVIRSVLLQRNGVFDDLSVELSELISALKMGLTDPSNVGVRSSIGGISRCLESLWRSKTGAKFANNLLCSLINCLDNSYWLIKVDLIESFSSLKWDAVLHRRNLQQTILDILLGKLSDEDPRVRSASVTGLVKFVENCGATRNRNIGNIHGLCETCVVKEIQDLPQYYPCGFPEDELETSLEIVINKICPLLVGLENKNAITGYYAALSALSEKYPPEKYNSAWRCKSEASEMPFIFTLAIDYIKTSHVAADLLVHQTLLTLATNLFIGTITSSSSSNASDDVKQQLSEYGIQLLYHSVTVLKVYHNTTKSSNDPAQNKKILLSPLSSPGRKTFKVDGDKKGSDEEFKRGDKDPFQNCSISAGLQLCSQHFEKIAEAVYQSWKIYKSNLDDNVEHKFTSLLIAALKTLGEVCFQLKTDYKNLPSLIEDVLGMTSTIFHLCPIPTLRCIRKMLQCLFCAKTFNEEEILQNSEPDMESFMSFWESYQPKPRQQTKSLYDPKLLGNYIRPFESIVITGLKMYTTSTDVAVHLEVLSLLSELIKGHVNYAHIDSNQIFLGFVVKQIGFLEEGHIREPELMITKMFEFLCLLSKEELRTKKFIDMERIVSLCESLFNCGQCPKTHCIPALRHVIYNLYHEPIMKQNVMSSIELRNLACLRERVFVLMLKLVFYPELLPLVLLMVESKKNNEDDLRFLFDTGNITLDFMHSLVQKKLVFTNRTEYECFLAILCALRLRVLPENDFLMKELEERLLNDQILDIHEFLTTYTAVTAIFLIFIRKYKNGDDVFIPSILVVEFFDKLCCNIKKSLPWPSPVLTELCITVVVVFLQCARILVNCKRNLAVKASLISGRQLTFYEGTKIIVRYSFVHPALRKEMIKFLCELENDDEYLWKEVFKSWLPAKLDLEFSIPTTVLLLRRLDKSPNRSLVNYILQEKLETLIWLSFSSLTENFISNLTEEESRIVWNQLSLAHVTKSLHETAVRNILKIMDALNISITKEAAIAFLKFISASRIPYFSLQLSQGACSVFQAVHLQEIKFNEEELTVVKQFISTNSNTLNFPRLVSLAKKSVAICEQREEWPVFEPDELQNFAARPVFFWCCGDITWSEGPALAKMLGSLPYTQIINIFNEEEFNTVIIPHAFRHIQYLLLQETMPILDVMHLLSTEKRTGLMHKWPLGVAAFDFVMESLDRLENKIPTEFKEALDGNREFLEIAIGVISEEKLMQVWSSIFEILKLRAQILKIEQSDENQIGNNFIPTELFTFSFLYVHGKLKLLKDVSIHFLQGFFDFAAIALKDTSFLHFFNVRDHPEQIFCCITSLAYVLQKMILKFNITFVCSQCDEAWADMNDNCVAVLRSFHCLTDFVSQVRRGQVWMEPVLFESFMQVVQGLARCDLVNSWILISHMGWKPQELTKNDIFPPILHIPVEILQTEKELLLKYIFKLNIFGIASKVQFEENWMNFLSVINSSGDDHFQNQIVIAGLRAITMMLQHSIKVNYVTDVLVGTIIKGLAYIDLILEEFEPEICRKYKLPQMTAEHSKLFKNKFHIDLNSCVRFLIELFSQWLQSTEKPPLALVTCVVETILNISEYFEEVQNYSWMFETFMNIFRGLEKEEEIVWPHLIYGIFVASAKIELEADTLNGLIQILEDSLASPFINVSNAALKSALVFLQSKPLCMPIVNAVIPFLLRNTELKESDTQSESRNYCVWELLLFVWVHGPLTGDEKVEFEKDLVGNIFTVLSPLNKCLVSVRLLVLKYLKQIVEMDVLRVEIKRKITRLSIEVLKTPNTAIFFDSLKLYLSIFYVDFKTMFDVPNPEPEVMMQMAERCEILFQTLRSGKRFNSLIVSKVLPLIVRDFLPPFEILNRVIAEFLSPQQSSPELVAPAVAQVFEKARRHPEEVALVREWIIASLPNFFSSSDISRTIWSLTFFFVGISTDSSMYNLLPFAELKRHSSQTRKLFVHASLDFYASLDAKEKEKFLELLRKGPFHTENSPYNFLLDLMSGLHYQ